MAKIQLSNNQLVVDGKDISRAVAYGSPNLRFQPDGSAKLNVDLVTTAFDIDVEGVVEVGEKPDPADVRTVVLAKPNDLLLIGNCGALADITADEVTTATKLFAVLGIKVVFFADDIDIAKLPADG